jgi:HrpA-like RNA helicase
VDIISKMEEWEMSPEEQKKPGAVLVFLPGIREINQVKQKLEAIVSTGYILTRRSQRDVVYLG